MLFDIVIWIIVGIFVADSLAELFMTAVVSILQVNRNSCLCVFHRIHGGKNGVFNTTMQDWINQGYTPLNAYDETKKSVAIPGTSEHATGLAVDIISTKYGELDEKQGDTEEQKWLMEHCSEYGFVLRFPQDKSNITGIIYEPWHYRYVGVDAAKEMTEKGLTLEEYVSAN